ncbi:MAG: aspartate dehydrogenase [Methanothrix sp.]|uniref:aspartate dehydrogenase n=1 Tax=Methanothrix sp. TaxID=90426 RepID=UPI0025FEE68E|nr:aspartate dehydrogenase [Methanothrix sp.]MCQ8902667.1 aspartate dehydrogenase [Methanothrix sp.]
MPLKVGLVGCGAIGFEIASAIDRGDVNADLAAVFDRNPKNISRLIDALRKKPEVVELERLVELSDIVVEAASQAAVPQVAEAALKRGKDIMIMSVGALMDRELYRSICSMAESNGCRVYIPSGAITGLDGLKSASIARLKSVVLTSTKPPAGLEGAPYVVEKKIDLHAFKEPSLIYEGPASEAVRAFPANVNVAATLSLTYGQDAWVRIVVDPDATVNVHEIVAEGDFGRMVTRVENVPSPRNPRTSYLAALSAIATLKNLTLNVRIGT